MDEDETQTVAELLRAPLNQFVSARSDAVRRLRASGQRERATRIAALRKPSTVVWALNQAARVATDDLAALRRAGQELRAAHEHVLRGDADAAEELRTASQRQREQVDSLSRRLGMVLSGAGHGAGDDAVRRIGDALRTLSIADDTEWHALQQGILSEEPQPSAFPMLEVVPSLRAAPAAAYDDVRRRRRIDAARAAVRRTEAATHTAREQWENAQRRLEEALSDLEAARDALSRAEVDR
jgi:hypothetical protein